MRILIVSRRPSEDGNTAAREFRKRECENIVRKLPISENMVRQPGNEANGKSPAAYLERYARYYRKNEVNLHFSEFSYISINL